MKGPDIKKLIDNLTPATLEVVRKLKPELLTAVKGLNELNEKKPTSLKPPPENIFNFLRRCPIEKTRVVIVYAGAPCTDGLFHPKMYPLLTACLLKTLPEQFMIGSDNSSDNSGSDSRSNSGSDSRSDNINITFQNATNYHFNTIEEWYARGVMVLNLQLTSKHEKPWRPFCDKLLRHLESNRVQMILLGSDGKKKKLKNSYTWDHPSTTIKTNKTDNEKNFIYCDCFKNVSEKINFNWGGMTVVSNQDNDPPLDEQTINTRIEAVYGKYKYIPARVVKKNNPFNSVYIFTDGGASDNGGFNCKASYGYYILADNSYISAGRVVGKQSNNTAELSAILQALLCIRANNITTPITLVYDSKYSVNTITKWVSTWEKKNREMENMDLIKACRDLTLGLQITYVHINSHQKEPADKNSIEWKKWHYNDFVDKLCKSVLAPIN